MKVTTSLLGEYTKDLDAIGPEFKGGKYPMLVIMFEDNRYVVFDYPKLDKLFSAVTGMLAARINANKARQNLVKRVKK